MNKIAIIGCGPIGKKRALALDDSGVLIACCDVDWATGGKFAFDFSCKFYERYDELFLEADCDIVIIAVVNKYARDIAIQALKMGKHVLAEKPLGRNASEAAQIVRAANSESLTVNSKQQTVRSKQLAANDNKPGKANSTSNTFDNLPITVHCSLFTVLKTGFNHRFHPAIWRAWRPSRYGE
ncbi:MAG: Gfo/Idh/MocA family oxidoreductase [Proteobacteria bacterium]|nr:Gfo/Idh/MocA family oxidoreductase [Pseudomonadota bacterium]